MSSAFESSRLARTVLIADLAATAFGPDLEGCSAFRAAVVTSVVPFVSGFATHAKQPLQNGASSRQFQDGCFRDCGLKTISCQTFRPKRNFFRACLFALSVSKAWAAPHSLSLLRGSAWRYGAVTVEGFRPLRNRSSAIALPTGTPPIMSLASSIFFCVFAEVPSNRQ
jgi:hypothetical protein